MKVLDSGGSDLYSAASIFVQPISKSALDDVAAAKSRFLETATKISLSPQAKAAMATAASDQRVADLLDEQRATNRPQITAPKIDLDLFLRTADALRTADGDESPGSSPLKRVEDPELQQKMIGVRNEFLAGVVARKSPEGAEAFRNAIRNGTLNVYRAADVPGVNYVTTVSETVDGATHSVRNNPSPEIKAEIDAGRAISFWNREFGDLYLTW